MVTAAFPWNRAFKVLDKVDFSTGTCSRQWGAAHRRQKALTIHKLFRAYAGHQSVFSYRESIVMIMIKKIRLILQAFLLLPVLCSLGGDGGGQKTPGPQRQQTTTTPTTPNMLNTPKKREGELYEGYRLNANIGEVRVTSCVSLGQPCNARVADLIKSSDQFVVAFMYRFDSPVIMDALINQYLSPPPSTDERSPVILTFLDYKQSMGTSPYHNYVKKLTDSVPTSLVRLGSKNFHQKVIICKKIGSQAFVIVGSANATYESESQHSEDMVIIQSNKLAKIYLEEFYKLLSRPLSTGGHTRAGEEALVYHLHRVHAGKSNIDVLPHLIQLVKSTTGNTDVPGSGHPASIVALGISTEFDQGNMRCMDELIKALQHPNKTLFFFQNYLTLPMTGKKSEKYQNLWNILKDKTPKLVVLDSASKDGDEAEGEAEKPADKTPALESVTTTTPTASVTEKRRDPEGEKEESAAKRQKLESAATPTPVPATEKKAKLNNASTVQQLIEHPADFPAVTPLLFTPYTGKKFHHKLVIQYPATGDPVVYTGSFHLSNSAIEQNSETIIGIQSKPLAQEYLASLLWQSGLGQETKVWKFINLHSALFMSDQPLTKTASKIYALTQKQMEGYFDRVTFMLENLLSSSSLQDIKSALKGHNEQITQDAWQKSNAQERLKLLQDVKKTVFDKLSDISNSLADSVKSLTGCSEIQQPFPAYTPPQNVPEWIHSVEQWVSKCAEPAKPSKQSKETIQAVNSLMSHLKNACYYPDSFVNLVNLDRELARYMQPQTSAVTVARETLQLSSP